MAMAKDTMIWVVDDDPELRKHCAKEKSNKFRSTISLGCFNQAALFHAKNNYFYVHLLK